MTKRDKLIQKILKGDNVTYDEAENVLLHLGYVLTIRGSHHSFRKDGGHKNIVLKKRKELFEYQVNDVREALKENGY